MWEQTHFVDGTEAREERGMTLGYLTPPWRTLPSCDYPRGGSPIQGGREHRGDLIRPGRPPQGRCSLLSLSCHLPWQPCA